MGIKWDLKSVVSFYQLKTFLKVFLARNRGKIKAYHTTFSQDVKLLPKGGGVTAAFALLNSIQVCFN